MCVSEDISRSGEYLNQRQKSTEYPPSLMCVGPMSSIEGLWKTADHKKGESALSSGVSTFIFTYSCISERQFLQLCTS